MSVHIRKLGTIVQNNVTIPNQNVNEFVDMYHKNNKELYSLMRETVMAIRHNNGLRGNYYIKEYADEILPNNCDITEDEKTPDVF